MALRIGWIFKTETVVMPAVLDLISGADWIRGFLPIFNRFGQSIPPLLASGWLASRKLKKRVLFATSLSMSICFGLFAALIGFRESIPQVILIFTFLVVYAIFFCCVGLNQTTLNTLHGKLLPARKRGSLMVFSSTFGVAAAVSSVVIVLPFLLQKDANAFHWIFAISATLFFFAALISILLIEPKDNLHAPSTRFWRRIPEAGKILKEDVDFRLFVLVAAIFGSSISLLPHYQSLAKKSSEFDFTWLLPWLAAQNIGSALFGTASGFVADRFGNRLALRVAILIQSMIPLIAIGLSSFFSNNLWAYVSVFFLLGNTPIIFRICNNYALESTGKSLHPQYLSCLAVCISLPCVCLSVPVGYLVGAIGCLPVFVGQSLVLLLGFLLTFRIAEPRDLS